MNALVPTMTVTDRIAIGPPGTKTMLVGAPGGGKTHALRTLLEVPDLNVFVLFTEPSGLTILGDTDATRFHWAYVPASQSSLRAMIDSADKLNTFTQGALQAMANVNPREYRQWIALLVALSDLKCERCGLSVGPIDKLDTDWCLAIDSLSPMNTMAMDLVAGGKPFKNISDWGAAIEQEAKLLNMLTLGQRLHSVLTAHWSRETDQLVGGVKLMPAALGSKFPQEIGRFFDDIAIASVEGTNYKWSTMTTGADSKARRLPLSKDLKPSFKPIFDAWVSKGGIIKRAI
jgi:hypothetical protein